MKTSNIIEMPDGCFIVNFTEKNYDVLCNEIASVANDENATVLHMGSVIQTDRDGWVNYNLYYISCGVIFKRLPKKRNDKIKG